MSEPPSNPRLQKLNSFLFQIYKKSHKISSAREGVLFIEAFTAQHDAATAVTTLLSSPNGLPTIQSSVRFSPTVTTFLNTHASTLLHYLRDNPELKNICGGEFLAKVLGAIVEPPIFLNAIVAAFREDRLDIQAQVALGWLLIELLTTAAGEKEKRADYEAIVRDPATLARFIDSPERDVRTFGQKLKHVLSALTSVTFGADGEVEDHFGGPGGRHDNDFGDFREVTVLPTADELACMEEAFLRVANCIEDPKTLDQRLGIHLDNQFRLLREDMIGEMKEELQIERGLKKGKHRGMVLEGFVLLPKIDCGELEGSQERFSSWGIRLRCLRDLPQLGKISNENARKAYFRKNKRLFPHNSVVCLIVDGEVVAFPTINRDERFIILNPPVLTLQIVGEASTKMALLKLKTAKSIKIVQLDTAIYSFEPILNKLQETKQLILHDEILCWNKDSVEELQNPPSMPQLQNIINSIEENMGRDLQNLLRTTKSVKLDPSQSESLLAGLRQRVSLIQGPPGTGKSFIGALLAKILHDHTAQTILVVCYTNHALDQFLEDLLSIGIPQSSLVRLGGKSTETTAPLALREQSRASGFKLTRATWQILQETKTKTRGLANDLENLFQRFLNTSIRSENILEYLEFPPEDPAYHEAFEVPEEQEAGMQRVGKKGKSVNRFYLLDRWVQGKDAGIFKKFESHTNNPDVQRIWAMPPPSRHTAFARWKQELLKDRVAGVATTAGEFNQSKSAFDRMLSEKDARLIASKRIVGCTTTAAAKYVQEVQAASPDVLLVEEAGEILESHILTALGPKTAQLILIGDHKQLRPKVNNYRLTVEKGEGFDLNRSMFERLVLKGFPHEVLSTQHRMRPEIAELVRQLTYPELVDAPGTKNRDNLRGFQDNLMFISHNHPEDDNSKFSQILVGGSSSSKRNSYEADMLLKTVRYLAQQGYGTSKMVVLTPYLGQLQLLKDVLGKDTDPILNDLDSHQLVRAGLLPQASAQIAKNPLKMSTIDNYQGDEADIVLVSMTRSNSNHDIGFMASPERLNVLLSRARDALIIFGNADTFLHARNPKGKQIYSQFFGMLKQQGHIYDGVPIKCERHPDRKNIVHKPADFEHESPDGGCTEPCGVELSCGLHTCRQRCHQKLEHSKMPCTFVLYKQCTRSRHALSWKCCKQPPDSCQKCIREDEANEEQRQRNFEVQKRRDEGQREHMKEMAVLDEKIDRERQALRDAQIKRERELAFLRKQEDLKEAAEMAVRETARPITLKKPAPVRPKTPPKKNTGRLKSEKPLQGGIVEPDILTPPISPEAQRKPASGSTPVPPAPAVPVSPPVSTEQSRRNNQPTAKNLYPLLGDSEASSSETEGPAGLETPESSDQEDSQDESETESKPPAPPPQPKPPKSTKKPLPVPIYKPKPFVMKDSEAEADWKYQKELEGVNNAAIDSLMDMTGLEAVKAQVLAIKAKIDATLRQGTDLKDERFGVSLLGNPGTGKTTVARLYAKFLASVNVLPGNMFIETTGSRLANEGIAGAKKHIETILEAGGGVLFLDEAYQLADPKNYGGAQVLDFLLAEIENNVGKLVVVLAGYNKEMEKFFEHNPGLPSRIPYSLQFEDYTDAELHQILKKTIIKKYDGQMEVEGGIDGLYIRIAIRRLGSGRGKPGFGNARALQNIFAQIRERQAHRLKAERRAGASPYDFYLTKEDIIGPDPSQALVESKAWEKLKGLVGLESVKESINSMFDRIQTNYRRELVEEPPMAVSLNRVFLGSPGTGKTSVAKCYGQILSEMGLLSNGEVITKNPADFIGSALGESEKNTKAILATTVGKVLIIDEAYMLDSSMGGEGSGGSKDPYKTAVIDTIVAEVQSVPGEDRCVLLLGYEEQIRSMFQNVNAGLSRRFAIDDAFHFQDFTSTQLAQILDYKLKDQGLDATEEAKLTACEVLEKARRRPNFGNAGEVENVLSKAKNRFQARQSKIPASERPVYVFFESQDFDPDHDRAMKDAGMNIAKLFEDVVGCEEVVAQLEGYQKIYRAMKSRGLNPVGRVPTNFVFKGPPGTGKTTTARKMGQVYYDMGFLGSSEVVDCSASDLVGQYVGQTGPKVKKQMEKALGKVLFIDEAYRLGEGAFAEEAVNEIVDLVTKPQFKDKIVIILAGYDDDMNKLMTVNRGLSSRFPEEVVFRNMSAPHCAELLYKELNGIGISARTLNSKTTAEYAEILEIIEDLSSLPNWGNARDIKTIAQTMVGQVFKAAETTFMSTLKISGKEIISILETTLTDREERATNVSSRSAYGGGGVAMAPPPTPRAPRTRTSTKTATKEKKQEAAKKPSEAPLPRDEGVTDEVWNQLNRDRVAAEELEKRAQENIARAKAELEKRKALEEEQRRLAEQLAAQKERDEAEQRRLEALRLAEEEARRVREEAERELERLRREEEARQTEKKKVQEKLRQMGVCGWGYAWVKQADGYRCAAGACFVSNAQLGI